MKFGKKRNKLIATLLSATVAVSIVGGMFAAPATSKFSDVPSNHWATATVSMAPKTSSRLARWPS